MELDYYMYGGVIKGIDKPVQLMPEARSKLSPEIQDELLNRDYPILRNYIAVEVKKKQVVEFLDRVLGVKSSDADRWRHIEVTPDELGKHEYFFVGLRALNSGRHLYCDEERGTCKYKTCPAGTRITSPFRLVIRRIRGLDIGRIWDTWDLNPRFVVSENMRERFEAENVTGLRYAPCELTSEAGKADDKKYSPIPYYVAEIETEIVRYAKKIYPRDWCKRHRIIMAYDACGVVTPRLSLGDTDFQAITALVVEGKKYRYRIPFWFVSRKVLEILLKSSYRDLRSMTLCLKQPFEPVVLD